MVERGPKQTEPEMPTQNDEEPLLYGHFGREGKEGKEKKEREKKERKKNKPLNRNRKKKIHLTELKLLAMNVNGIRSPKKSNLAELAIHECQADIIILTETKMGKDNEFIPKGYQNVTQINRKSVAGGLMVLAKDSIKIHDAKSESLIEKIQVAKFKFNDLTIFGVYRSPSVDTAKGTGRDHHRKLINYLDSNIKKLGTSPYIITGDFNLPQLTKWDFNPPGLKPVEDGQEESIDHMWSKFYNRNDLEQYVTTGTYTRSENVLDIVLAPKGITISSLEVSYDKFGPDFDHYPVLFTVDMDFSVDVTPKFRRKPTEATWKIFKKDLTERDVGKNAKLAQFPPDNLDPDLDQETSPFNHQFFNLNYNPYEDAENNMADFINNNLKEAYKNATPEVEIKIPPPGGHLHKDTKSTIRKSKDFAKTLKWASINGKWSPGRLEKAKKELKIIKKSYTWRMKKDREANEIRRLETSEHKNKNFFEHMKDATKKKTTQTGPVKDKNGILRTSDPEVAQAFNETLEINSSPENLSMLTGMKITHLIKLKKHSPRYI